MQGEKYDHSTQAGKQDSSLATPQPPRQRQRKTAVVLSVITCLFMGIIGFEIINDKNGSSDTNPGRDNDRSSSVMMFSKNKEYEEVGISGNILALADGPHAVSQITKLQEENRLQSEKIKALTDEIIQTNMMVGNLRPELFLSRETLRDIRLDEMERKITAKDELNGRLKGDIQTLQEELTDNQKKINQMQTTIDSLTSALENHKSMLAKAEEKSMLLNELAENVEEFAIQKQNYLDQLTRSQYQANAKSDLIKELTVEIDDYTKQKQNLEKELAAAKESASLKGNLLNELTLQIDEFTKRSFRLENEIVTAREHEKIKSDLMSELESHVEDYIQQKKQIEQELAKAKETTNALQKDLETALSNFESEHKRALAFEEQINTLENTETASNKTLEGLKKDFQATLEDFDVQRKHSLDVEEQLKLELNRVNTEYSAVVQELDKARQELSQYQTELQKALASYDDHHQHSSDIEEQLKIELNKINAEYATVVQELDKTRNEASGYQTDLQKALANYDDEHQHSNDLEQHLKLELNKLSADYTSAQEELNKARAEASSLHADLQKALANYEDEHKHLLDIEEQLKSDLNKVNAEYAAALQELDKNRQSASGFQTHLETALANYENEHKRSLDHEEQLQQALDKISSLNQEIAARQTTDEKHQEIEEFAKSLSETKNDLMNQLEKISAELDQEKTKSLSLKNQLDSALNDHDAYKHNNEEQEQKLHAIASQLSEKEANLAAAEQKIDDLIRQMEQASDHNRNLVQEKENIHSKYKQEIAQLSNPDQLDQLKTDLKVALANYEEEHKHAQEIENQLKSYEDRFHNESAHANAQEGLLNQLSSNLQEAIANYENEHKKVMEIQEQLKLTAEKTATLEQELSSSRQIADATHQELNERAHSLSNAKGDLEDQLQKLAAELDDEKSKSQNLNEDLSNALHDHDAEKQTTFELEQKLQHIALQLNEKEKHLSIAEQKISEMLARMEEMSQQNHQLMIDKADLEEKYHQELVQVSNQENLLNQLTEDLNNQKIALEKIEKVRQDLANELENENKHNEQ